MKRQEPPPPRTLLEAAERHEERRHAYQLRAIKDVASHLKPLDPWVPEIKAACGLDLMHWASSIEWNRRERCLYLHPTDFSGQKPKLHAALLALGFREVERRAPNSWSDWVLMQSGRLRLGFYLDKPREPRFNPLAASDKPEAASA